MNPGKRGTHVGDHFGLRVAPEKVAHFATPRQDAGSQ